MENRLYLCTIDDRYIQYLYQFDTKVLHNKNQSRKYVGVVLTVQNTSYFAPMASPKIKHIKMKKNQLDIFKIDDGKLGIINFNNMIPVPRQSIHHFDIDSIEDQKYQMLLRKQVNEIHINEADIVKKAQRLYNIVISNKQPKLNKRCCNFSLLETKCKTYRIQ